MVCPTCEPLLTYYLIHHVYLSVSRFNNVYYKNVDQVQQTLSNKNQVRSFSFSLSTTFHPDNFMSLSCKSTHSPSDVSKSSSVTTVTSQISLSSVVSSSSSLSYSAPDSSSRRILVFITNERLKAKTMDLNLTSNFWMFYSKRKKGKKKN